MTNTSTALLLFYVFGTLCTIAQSMTSSSTALSLQSSAPTPSTITIYYDSISQCQSNCSGDYAECRPTIANNAGDTTSVVAIRFECQCLGGSGSERQSHYFIDQSTCRRQCSDTSKDIWYADTFCERVNNNVDNAQRRQSCQYKCVQYVPIWLLALFALIALASVVSITFVVLVLPCCLCCPCCVLSATYWQRKIERAALSGGGGPPAVPVGLANYASCNGVNGAGVTSLSTNGVSNGITYVTNQQQQQMLRNGKPMLSDNNNNTNNHSNLYGTRLSSQLSQQNLRLGALV